MLFSFMPDETKNKVVIEFPITKILVNFKNQGKVSIQYFKVIIKVIHKNNEQFSSQASLSIIQGYRVRTCVGTRGKSLNGLKGLDWDNMVAHSSQKIVDLFLLLLVIFRRKINQTCCCGTSFRACQSQRFIIIIKITIKYY